MRLGADGGITGIRHYWWANDLYAKLSRGLDDGNWHHVAATYDGTTRKIFVDSSLLVQDNPAPPNVVGTENFCIGSSNGDEYFKGEIRNVKIWKEALSFGDDTLISNFPLFMLLCTTLLCKMLLVGEDERVFSESLGR